ncbi:FadR/GntR family transcriptional regulator [Microbacterium sp.]|uniref:FadR/GntR family transcriptional regulator n=1 Tax=Microbacterium sp. TaxID=51671 RepID=UPI003A8BE724
MPHTTGRSDAAYAVVFSPLDGAGRAELVQQRLTDAIVSGILRDGERLPSESDLSRSFGVALVTAREALEGMRDKGLVITRRGRDGGSFVTFDHDVSTRVFQRRLREHSRIELRDMVLHVSAIAGTAAETATERATDDDIAALERLAAGADLSTGGGARRAVGRFHLEVAAISQSPRLVHEEVRLQSEAGPLLWMCLQHQEHRDRAARAWAEVIAALRRFTPGEARTATIAHIDDAFHWLLDERARVDGLAAPATEEHSP